MAKVNLPLSAIKGGIGEGDNKTKPISSISANRYTAWGSLAPVAQSQGWYPASFNSETTEYRNTYGNQFNQVVLPNSKERGYVSVIGGNKNNVMDVVIKDSKGNIIHKLLEKVRPDQVDAYFKSTIEKRANSVGAGTNIDRMKPDGTYVALR